MANTTNVGDVSVEYPAEGVGMVVINNPPMNMWYLGLAKKMSDGMDEVRESGAKVLILASDTPGYFLAHMSLQDSIDIAEGRDPTGDFVGMAKCGAELRLGPMVSIAVNNGQCWGGGCELFSTANLRVAGESATFGQPEVIMGSMAAGAGTSRIPRVIGEARAMELLLDGRPITARKALHWGFVNRVFPDETVREEAIKWGALIASRPAYTLQAIKRSIGKGLDLASHKEAFANEYQVNTDMIAPHAEENMVLRKGIQARYDAGADSWDAWEIEREVIDWDD